MELKHWANGSSVLLACFYANDIKENKLIIFLAQSLLTKPNPCYVESALSALSQACYSVSGVAAECSIRALKGIPEEFKKDSTRFRALTQCCNGEVKYLRTSLCGVVTVKIHWPLWCCNGEVEYLRTGLCGVATVQIYWPLWCCNGEVEYLRTSLCDVVTVQIHPPLWYCNGEVEYLRTGLCAIKGGVAFLASCRSFGNGPERPDLM
ncbi:hypothetical protein Fmac_012080 [Flemingia macrophylla]|uniref:Uncharacterized protein n=1 Tax=Flemingia macrophylla TaxID=520843 RepID=A0ABD1MP90_9FABA